MVSRDDVPGDRPPARAGDAAVAHGLAQPGCSRTSTAGCTGCCCARNTNPDPGWAGALPPPAPVGIPAVAMATAIYIYIFFPLITGTSRATASARGCFHPAKGGCSIPLLTEFAGVSCGWEQGEPPQCSCCCLALGSHPARRGHLQGVMGSSAKPLCQFLGETLSEGQKSNCWLLKMCLSDLCHQQRIQSSQVSWRCPRSLTSTPPWFHPPSTAVFTHWHFGTKHNPLLWRMQRLLLPCFASARAARVKTWQGEHKLCEKKAKQSGPGEQVPWGDHVSQS